MSVGAGWMGDNDDMLRAHLLAAVGMALLLGAGCRTVEVVPHDDDDGGNVASVGATTGAGLGGFGGQGSCTPPPPPSPEPTSGCSKNDGDGWVSVPCDCQLWLTNPEVSPIAAALELTVSPPDQVPALSGPLDVEVAFDDASSALFTRWSAQAGNGSDFSVHREGTTTTVRMGKQHVVLDGVPIGACATTKGNAFIAGGNWTPLLSMHATLSDQEGPLVTVDATCSNPPPTGPAP